MGLLGKNRDYSFRLARDTEFRNGAAVPCIGNSCPGGEFPVFLFKFLHCVCTVFYYVENHLPKVKNNLNPLFIHIDFYFVLLRFEEIYNKYIWPVLPFSYVLKSPQFCLMSFLCLWVGLPIIISTTRMNCQLLTCFLCLCQLLKIGSTSFKLGSPNSNIQWRSVRFLPSS